MEHCPTSGVTIDKASAETREPGEAAALLSPLLQHPESSSAQVEAEATTVQHKPGLARGLPTFTALIHAQEWGSGCSKGRIPSTHRMAKLVRTKALTFLSQNRQPEQSEKPQVQQINQPPHSPVLTSGGLPPGFISRAIYDLI